MMIFVSYKFNGENERELQQMLCTVADYIRACGHDSFIYNRDIKHAGDYRNSACMPPNKDIILSCFDHIHKSDALVALIQSREKSEGMLLEIGYAKALGKKIILALQKDVEAEAFRFVCCLSDEVIVYDSLSELSRALGRALS